MRFKQLAGSARTLSLTIPLILGIITSIYVLRVGPQGHGAALFEAYDFRALYCGGQATLEHENPYRVEPVRSCEHNEYPTTLFKSDVPAWVVLPAPYPGYALELFSQFARAPYPLAKAIWLGLLVASIGFLVPVCARLSGWSPIVVTLVLLPTALLSNVWLGSTPPLAMLAVALSALAMLRGKPGWAVPPLALAMIDPHLALPAGIALAVVAPKARVAIAAGLCVLVALSLHAIGLPGNLEYFNDQLPMHARAEVFVRLQYSLTHLLAISGVPIDAALRLGSASYAALAIFAIYNAFRDVRDDLGGARAIALPVAIVALGGTFIHNQEISLALPALFVMVRSADTKLNRLLLTIGFIGVLFSPTVFNLKYGAPTYILGCVAIASALWPSRRVVAGLSVAVIAASLIFGVRELPHKTFTDLAAASLPEPPGIVSSTRSGVVWADFLKARPSWTQEDPASFAMKIPTWIGLISVFALAVRTRRARAAVVSLFPERNRRRLYSIANSLTASSTPPVSE